MTRALRARAAMRDGLRARRVRAAADRRRRAATACSPSRGARQPDRRRDHLRAAAGRVADRRTRRAAARRGVWGDTRIELPPTAAGTRCATCSRDVVHRRRAIAADDRPAAADVDARRGASTGLPDRAPGTDSRTARSSQPDHALPDDHRRRVHRLADPRRCCSRRTSPTTSKPTSTPTSDHFVHVLESTCRRTLEHGNRVEVFTNGDSVLSGDARGDPRRARDRQPRVLHLQARARSATSSSRRCAERARAGVRVTLVLDAIGSFGAFRADRAAAARGRLPGRAYQRFTWYRLGRLNNRTHRELLVVDGDVAFVGGAGVADWWAKPHARQADVARHDGAHRRAGRLGHPGHRRGELARVLRRDPDRARDLQAAPAGRRRRRRSRSRARRRTAPTDVARAVPDADRGRERQGAASSTPYFLPDKAFREAICRTAGARRRASTVIVPGPHTDQRWVRLASRRMYGQLLEAGVRIFEYDAGHDAREERWSSTTCGR